jgi:hypothetical protein
MTQLPALTSPQMDTEIAALARAFKTANGPVMSLLNRLGGSMEGQLALLPDSVRAQIDRVTESALLAAHGLASVGARAPDVGPRGTLAVVMATGAAGGAGGLPSAIAELPVTITLLLHAIRREAQKAGFNPDTPAIRSACLQVFAAGAPVAADDGLNTAFLSARLTVTGPALHKVIATIAPRLATAMGQKLAAQAIPILGAISGAALNAVYLGYYREMARIRFALMTMAEHHGAEPVLTAFRTACTPPRIVQV